MKIWINKDSNEKPTEDVENYAFFAINRLNKGTIYSNVAEIINRMNIEQLSPIYEDLLVISLSIFAIDKKMPRYKADDAWTRELNVSIPVLEFEKWNSVRDKWNNTLSYLTGDNWNISFRNTDIVYTKSPKKYRKFNEKPQCDVVCLFSGGLDSFCGAITLLEQGYSPCLVGHNEYPKLRYKQQEFARMFKEEYTENNPVFYSFSANTRNPININKDEIYGKENTSRGRSLLFLSVALCFASILGENTPVFIPENGFIGLNIPLTNNRKGSCSTRTTHPFFINSLREILNAVGINNQINNIFAYESKRDIINRVKDTRAFINGYMDTISCSHPCQPRWNKHGSREYPKNCGYCYPCIIRKSSLLDVDEDLTPYSEPNLTLRYLRTHDDNDKTNDFCAMISSVYRCSSIDDDELSRLVRLTGRLTDDEVEKFINLYRSTINDVTELFSKDDDLIRYIGI